MKRLMIATLAAASSACTGLNPDFGSAAGDTEGGTQSAPTEGPASKTSSETADDASASGTDSNSTDSSTTSAGSSATAEDTGTVSACSDGTACVPIPSGWQGPIRPFSTLAIQNACPDKSRPLLQLGTGAVDCSCDAQYGPCTFDILTHGDNACVDGGVALEMGVPSGCYDLPAEKVVSFSITESQATAVCAPPEYIPLPNEHAVCSMRLESCGPDGQGYCNADKGSCIYASGKLPCPTDDSGGWQPEGNFFAKVSCQCEDASVETTCGVTATGYSEQTCGGTPGTLGTDCIVLENGDELASVDIEATLPARLPGCGVATATPSEEFTVCCR